MDLDKARDFVREHHRAILSTTRDDGTPQMSPVLVAVDSDGCLTVSSRETALKTRNLRKRPSAAVLVLSDGFFGSWVQVSGDVEIVSMPAALEPLVDYYRSVSGEHDDWDEYRAAMVRDQRCVIRITPRRAGPDIEG
jgi:PPOX class probable F420-dependent enzyme